MNFFGGGAGAGVNRPFVFDKRFEGAEPMRLNSDGLLDGAGVTELTGCSGLLFNCGTIVVPAEGIEPVLLLYFDEPSDLANEADDPGSTRSVDVDPPAESLEPCFAAKGFKLLNQFARAGEIAASNTASMTESRPMAFTVPNP